MTHFGSSETTIHIGRPETATYMEITMRNLFSLMCFSLGLLIAPTGDVECSEPFRYQVGKHGLGELKYVDCIPVLILQGTPEEMGEQTGVLAVRQAKSLYNFPRDYFLGECTIEILRTNPKWTKQDAQFKLAIMAAELALWPQVQKKAARLEDNFPRAYRSELKAITDAAGKDVVSHHQLVAGNGLFDMGHIPQSELARGCSSVIIPPRLSANMGLLFGRNLDFYHFGYLQQYSLLMAYRSSDPKKHSFVSAGFPGLVGCFTGMNDVGLTIASHEVQEPDTTTLFNPKGVLFAMAYRRVLEECATIGDAVKLLDGMERASVTSLVIADTEGGAVIEVTPDTIAVRRFKDNPGVCTNHFCAMKNPKQKEQFDTFKRFDTLTNLVTLKKDRVFGIEDVQRGLHDARLLDGNKVNMTIQTFVFEPSEKKVHLRFGSGDEPSTSGKLTSLDLNKLWGK